MVCAVFTGIRGGLFTMAMVRMNVRVRTRLFHSLLGQEVGFFDVNKTGARHLCAHRRCALHARALLHLGALKEMPQLGECCSAIAGRSAVGCVTQRGWLCRGDHQPAGGRHDHHGRHAPAGASCSLPGQCRRGD